MSIFGILAQLSPTILWFGIHMLSNNILEFLLLYISCTFTADTRSSWERGGGVIKAGVPVVASSNPVHEPSFIHDQFQRSFFLILKFHRHTYKLIHELIYICYEHDIESASPVSTSMQVNFASSILAFRSRYSIKTMLIMTCADRMM